MKMPIGMATIIAITEITSVPRNTGTAPKAPAPATWSGRMAICGSQRSPKKNSCGGTISKKAQASQSSEAMMPTVVRIATTAQASMNQSRNRSTPVRARKRGESRARAKKRPASISASAVTKRAMRTMPCQRTSRSAAAATSAEGSVKALPAATFLISASSSERSRGVGAGGQRVGQAAPEQRVDRRRSGTAARAARGRAPARRPRSRRRRRGSSAASASTRPRPPGTGGRWRAPPGRRGPTGREWSGTDSRSRPPPAGVGPRRLGGRRGRKDQLVTGSIGLAASTAARIASRSASSSAIRPRSGR